MKTRTKTLLTALTTSALLALATGSAHAASIQFDVGNLQGSYSGTEAAAHAAGDLGAGDTTWNTVIGDASSGFFYTDGSAATGITVDFGLGAGDIDWSSAPGPSNVGGATTSGIYDTALMRDWLFTNGSNLGVRIKGLAAGEYTVYALVKEPTASTRTYDVGIGVDTDDTTALGDLTTQSIAAGLPETWTAGTNYVAQAVTVSSTDDWIVIITDPTNASFGTLQGFQIVPEPSSLALLGMGGLLIARRRRN